MKRFKIISVLICLLSVIPCMGATIYVDNDAPNDPCHGNPDYSDPLEDGSAEHPFDAIQEGIDKALDGYSNDGDIIVVSPGTYTGVGNRDIVFDGKAITVRSTDPNDPIIVTATIIDCENSGRGFLFLSGEDANSIVDGFTITNGKGDLGGGMQIENSSPTVRNCIFSGNIANYVGGGIYCYQSSPTVKNCVFNGNSSSNGGGGVYNWTNSNPNLSNCTFINNSAYKPTGVCSGGGIHNRFGSSPIITNCRFIGNTAKQDGGGIYNQTSSNPNIINCTFINNSGRSGGGIYNSGSNPKIVNCTFSKNSANPFNYGGAISNYSSSPKILNCIIWDNQGKSPSEIYPTTLLTVSYSAIKGIAVYPGEGNINIDPLFVDPDANDFHLQPDSPCIDEGDPCGIYTDQTDIDGQPRVYGDFVDMGSDEAWPVDILTFINEAVSEQTLWGTGPGKSAKGRLGALRNMVETADNLIEAELFEEGCQQLRDAYRRTDGQPRPPDFVSGPAAPELAGMIEDLMLDLGCE